MTHEEPFADDVEAESNCSDKAPTEGRTPDGRFAPGNQLGTPFGPDNPPPKSPGRPPKDAWLHELEQRLEDPRMRQALADKLLKIALKGGERAFLQAIDMIQSRVGGPVTQRIEAEVVSERRILIVGGVDEVPPLPEQILELERLRGEAEEEAQVNRDRER